MLWAVVTATALMMVLNVPIGLLADKIGATRLLVGAGVLFSVTGSVSYLTMTGTFTSLLFAYGSGVVYLVCVTTVLPKLLTEIFPPQNRALGVGLPNAVTGAVLGAIGPAAATYTAEHDADGWFVAGVMAAVLLSIPAALLARRTPRPTTPPSTARASRSYGETPPVPAPDERTGTDHGTADSTASAADEASGEDSYGRRTPLRQVSVGHQRRPDPVVDLRILRSDRRQPVDVPVEHAERGRDEHRVVHGLVVRARSPGDGDVLLRHRTGISPHLPGDRQQGPHPLAHRRRRRITLDSPHQGVVTT